LDIHPLVPVMQGILDEIADNLAQFNFILKHLQAICLR
jgi:hypothetical protein